MAKGKKILPAAASIEFTYHGVNDMPWKQIEQAACKNFSDEQRKEIFYCTQGFDWEYQHLSKAPSLSEINMLRAGLVKHCTAILGLVEQYPHKQDPAVADVVSALQIYFGTEDFYFREAYQNLSKAALEISIGLTAEAQFEADTLSKTPESAGLIGFMRRVLDGAERVTARSTPDGVWAKQGHEYRRWGMSVGPRAKRLPGCCQTNSNSSPLGQ